MSTSLVDIAPTLIGGFLGAVIVMTTGKDWKSQAWKRYADRVSARGAR